MKRILSALTLAGTTALACGSEPQEATAFEKLGAAAACTGSGGAAGAGPSMDASIGDVGAPPRDSRVDEPFVPGPPYIAPAHQGNLIHVKNGCSFPLWLHGVGGGAVLSPDDLQLAPGATHDYTVGDWPFAWVTAYVDGPQRTLIDRAELTLFPAGLVSYRLAYIDGIGLPMELLAIGQGADCKRVGCYVPEAQILAQCPDGLLSGKRCRSAGDYCGDPANASKPYCHALDPVVARCAQSVAGCQDAATATTSDVYRCESAFGDNPNLCAALNRGMLGDPLNTYAAWLHGICPGLYAFPYDDAPPAEDAFHACQSNTTSTQLNITFCPAG